MTNVLGVRGHPPKQLALEVVAYDDNDDDNNDIRYKHISIRQFINTLWV